MEDEADGLRQKCAKQASNNSKLFEVNEKLQMALKTCKEKVKKLKTDVPRVCTNCNHSLTMNMTFLEGNTLDGTIGTGSFMKEQYSMKTN